MQYLAAPMLPQSEPAAEDPCMGLAECNPQTHHHDDVKQSDNDKEEDRDVAEMSAHLQNEHNHVSLKPSYWVPALFFYTVLLISKANYKYAYVGLILLCSMFGKWSTLAVVLLASLLTLLSSFQRGPHPLGIPLAPASFDVLLGRPLQVSTHDPHLKSNNNVTLTTFQGRYVLAYRQSDVHHPSGNTRIVVAHSQDLSQWKVEWTYSNGMDLRETLLFQMNGRLILYFFSLKPVNWQFKPLNVCYTTSEDGFSWIAPKKVCIDGEVPWEIKVYGKGDDAIAYKTSYLGNHYGGEGTVLFVLFEQSKDGLQWGKVDGAESSIVYRGGVSEVSFEFTAAGDLVAIGRNEDGDETGFGSQLFYARKDNLSCWIPLRVSLPWRFDSPRLMRCKQDQILLCARYAPIRYQLSPSWLRFIKQKLLNLIAHSALPKAAAVYSICPFKQWGESGIDAVQFVKCFEHTVGDTGFFSITRELGFETEEFDNFIVANYSSVHCHSHAPWVYGQLGTSHVYVSRCRILSQDA